MSARSTVSEAPPVIPDHELLRPIGSGAYGEVWLARNVMGAWRAVKIVRQSGIGSGRPYEREFAGIQRFEPVSRSHESQIDVLHVGRNDRAGYFYYVMELGDDVTNAQEIDPLTYEPRTLRSELERRGRLSPAKCLEIGIPLCTALEHLHAHQLVHRDIKPANVIFVHGRPKLADIGLVAQVNDPVSFVGTEGFVPPEGPGSQQADLFSLGKVLYELHTGLDRKRFPELPESNTSTEDPLLAQELNLIIVKACAPAAHSRHKSVRELREELQLLQSGRSIRRLRQAEKRAVLFRRFSILAAALAFVACVGYFSARDANRRADAHAAEARAELLKARYSQARAVRLSGHAGRRAEALNAIREAARVRPSRQLRDEAIAALALVDLEPTEIFIPHPAPAINKAQGHPARSGFSDDLSRVAWCNDDGSVLIMDVADRQREIRLAPPSDGSTALGLTWSPNGRYLAVAYRGAARVWEVASKKVICHSDCDMEPSDAGPPVSFSADSSRAALPGPVHARIFSLPEGEQIRRGKLPQETLEFRMHPHEPWLATRTVKELQVINYETGELVKFYGLTSAIVGIQWSPDGRLLGAMLRGGELYVADVYSRNKMYLAGHPDRPLHLAFSPDGQWLVSAARDGTTRLWNALGTGLSSAVSYNGLAQKFSSEGDRIAFTRADGVGVWKFAQPEPFYSTLIGRLGIDLVEHLDFSPDGRWMISMSQGPDGLWVWDLETRQISGHGFGLGPRRQWLQFTPDGRRLVTLGDDGLQSWPIQRANGSLELGEPATIELEPGRKLRTIVGSLSHDGRSVLAGLQYLVHAEEQNLSNEADEEAAKTPKRVQVDRLHLLDLERGTAVNVWEPGVELRSVSLSPDGKRCAIGTHQGEGTKVLEIEGLKPVRTIGAADANVAYSPDGKWLVNFTPAACEFYYASTLRFARSFPRLQIDRNPGAMAFSKNGGYFAYLKRRSQVELVNARTLESLATFELPDGTTADAVDLSSDGQWLAIHDKVRCHLYNLPILHQHLKQLGLEWPQETLSAQK